MKNTFPNTPPVGTPMAATNASEKARELLALRRSTPKQCLTEPGPDASQLQQILQIAARVPDHRRVEPWRFIVFKQAKRAGFGEKLARIFEQKNPGASEEEIEIERGRFMRAPVVIAVISAPDPNHKTPVWEQELSAGAACMTLLLAANAAGWAGTWLTEWLAFDAEVAALMGLTAPERVAGFIYLGTASAQPPERPRPNMHDKTVYWEE